MPEAREAQTHALRRLVIEATCASPERAPALWERVSRLCAGALPGVLDGVLSAHGREDEVLRIERLEVDVGTVRESHLEEDLLEALRRALDEALARRLARGNGGAGENAPRVERATAGHRRGDSLRFLLLRGVLPWWHTGNEPRELEALFQGLARAHPEEVRRVLAGTGRHAHVRRRLALQLSEPSLRDIVQLVEQAHAPFVFAYVEELERRQAEAHFLPASTRDFRVAKWELVLAYLLEERGSHFNTRQFVRSTIAAMARRYNVDFAELLAHLREVLPVARFERPASPLRDILDELWRETVREGSAAAVSPEGGGDEAARLEARLTFIASTLERGLPEGEKGPEGLGFDEAVRFAAREPSRLRWVLLAHWHRPRVRARLAERPASLLEGLVRSVLPGHAPEVLAYERHLRRAHAHRPLFRGDAQAFQRTRWRILLECLVLQQGSTFNTRAFLRATLERLAAHHNLEYGQLLTWVWRELEPLQRASASSRPLLLHVGALHREASRETRRQGREVPAVGAEGVLEALRRAFLARTPGGALFERALRESPSRLAAFLSRLGRAEEVARWVERGVSAEVLGRLLRAVVAPPHRTMTWALIRFAEGLPIPGVPRGRVRSAALAFLLAARGQVAEPRALLALLLREVAATAGVPLERVLVLAARLPRRQRGGTAREAVRGLAAEVARDAGVPVEASGPTPSQEAVRVLERRLLFGEEGSAGDGKGTRFSDWLERLERTAPPSEHRRLAGLLRDEETRRRALRSASDDELLRVFAWRHSGQAAAVAQALDALRPVLGSRHLSEAVRAGLREAFWRYLWTDWSGRAGARGVLLRSFLAWLSHRAPRVFAAVAALPAGAALTASVPRRDRPRAAREKPAERREELSSEEKPERIFMTRSAGLVLLWPLMTRYFDKLGLLADGSFKGVEAQERATGMLQFLATGQVSFQEPDLVLNKLLCGLAPESPVPTAVEVDDAIRALTEGMLSFVLQQWPAVKNTSVQGLRGSFLCREGRLQAGDENWTLEVEPKAYDLLLDSWPWPLSIVKLPWMPRPLHVRWRK